MTNFRDRVLADTLDDVDLRREFIEECERIIDPPNPDVLVWACALRVRVEWLIVAVEVAERQLADARGLAWCTDHRRPFAVHCPQCVADLTDARYDMPEVRS